MRGLDEEPQVLALRHAYCYLRLCGLTEPAALAELRTALNGAGDGVPGEAVGEALLQDTIARAAGIPGTAMPSPRCPPPLRRGHVRFP